MTGLLSSNQVSFSIIMVTTKKGGVKSRSQIIDSIKTNKINRSQTQSRQARNRRCRKAPIFTGVQVLPPSPTIFSYSIDYFCAAINEFEFEFPIYD